MRYILFSLLSLGLLFSGCKSAPRSHVKQEGWRHTVVADNFEIFIDTTSITQQGSVVYAREKRVFTTAQGRQDYISKIRNEYIKMDKPEKIEKWNDFSYCIYNALYECTNKRFRILSIEDYDSKGKLIVKTIPPKNPIRWLNIDNETIGDYTFFFICDYGK